MTPMRRFTVALVLAVSMGLVTSGTAHADETIPVPSDWVGFFFEGTGSFNPEGAFTFTSSRPVLVSVTDIACAGDEFRVFVDGVAVGDTTSVADDLDCNPSEVEPDVAFADPRYSHGTFRVGPGTHGITIQITASPFGGGSAFLRVEFAPSATPTSKGACKKGGWRNLTNDQGQPFRNQGQCVAFVARRR